MGQQLRLRLTILQLLVMLLLLRQQKHDHEQMEQLAPRLEMSSSSSSSKYKMGSTGSIISGSAYRPSRSTAKDYGRDNHRHHPQIASAISHYNSVDKIPALFVFGDSLSDSGNGPFVDHFTAYELPYGETVPGYADGRTITCDFLGMMQKSYRPSPMNKICLSPKLQHSHVQITRIVTY